MSSDILGRRRCVRLGDPAYEALATYCPGVRELRLYASMPSAKAVQGLAALRQLQVIDLCGAHAVTGASLVNNNPFAENKSTITCSGGLLMPVRVVSARRF